MVLHDHKMWLNGNVSDLEPCRWETRFNLLTHCCLRESVLGGQRSVCVTYHVCNSLFVYVYERERAEGESKRAETAKQVSCWCHKETLRPFILDVCSVVILFIPRGTSCNTFDISPTRSLRHSTHAHVYAWSSPPYLEPGITLLM